MSVVVQKSPHMKETGQQNDFGSRCETELKECSRLRYAFKTGGTPVRNHNNNLLNIAYLCR